MALFLAADHAGVELKEALMCFLESEGVAYVNCGVNSADVSVDYPDYADKVLMQMKPSDKAVLVCGSGVGMAIRANRYAHIRALVGHKVEEVIKARKHNDCNVLCLAGRTMDLNGAELMLTSFLATQYEGGRHNVRLKKLNKPIK